MIRLHILYSLLALFVGAISSPAFAGFPDVPARHGNADAINYVLEHDIVRGYQDGTYRPASTINRAEFTKILIGANFDQEHIARCMLSNQEQMFFPDVIRTEWFGPYICVARDEGIIQGYPDRTFRPGANINFVEASKIIAKTFYSVQQDPDAGQWFASFVQELSDRKAIPESIQTFDSPVTRGEMAEIIYRIKTDANKPSKTYDQLAEDSAPEGNTMPVVHPLDTSSPSQSSASQSTSSCDSGWECKDSTHKGFRKSNCTWKLVSTCEFGCEYGKCKDDPCDNSDCGNYCENDIFYYNGRCMNGECKYTLQSCTYGCENNACLQNPVVDPCKGVTCPDYCAGGMRYYNGSCEDGQCQYITQQCLGDCMDGQCVAASEEEAAEEPEAPDPVQEKVHPITPFCSSWSTAQYSASDFLHIGECSEYADSECEKLGQINYNERIDLSTGCCQWECIGRYDCQRWLSFNLGYLQYYANLDVAGEDCMAYADLECEKIGSIRGNSFAQNTDIGCCAWDCEQESSLYPDCYPKNPLDFCENCYANGGIVKPSESGCWCEYSQTYINAWSGDCSEKICSDTDANMSGLGSLQTYGYCEKYLKKTDKCTSLYDLSEAACDFSGECVANDIACDDFFEEGFCKNGACGSCAEKCSITIMDHSVVQDTSIKCVDYATDYCGGGFGMVLDMADWPCCCFKC